MAGKTKILFLAANPTNALYRPHLDKEAREIYEKIQMGSKRESFEFITHWAVTPDDMQTTLLRHKPHIVHFSGHGSRNEEIILEDRDGNMKPVGKKALEGLFKVLKDNIRVVVLNACHAKPQAEAINETIDFTIGMNKAIGDQAAIVFAASFYRGLSFGRSVQEAFDLATNQLELESIPESETPMLAVRKGVNASKAYLNKKPRTQKTGATREAKKVGGPNSVIGEIIKDSIIVTGKKNKLNVKR